MALLEGISGGVAYSGDAQTFLTRVQLLFEAEGRVTLANHSQDCR